jgi:hypothetical protein
VLEKNGSGKLSDAAGTEKQYDDIKRPCLPFLLGTHPLSGMHQTNSRKSKQ